MLSLGSNWTSRRLPHLLSCVSRVIREGTKRSQSLQASHDHRHSLQLIDDRLSRIDAYVRRSGRVTRRDVDDVYKDVLLSMKAKVPATSSQSLLLIRCCGSLLSEEPPSVRNELVHEIFTTLSNSTKLDISHYNALLQVYIDNGFPFNPLDILSEIQGKGIEPNRVTYQRLIHRYCHSGDIEGATKILEFMKTKELPINESVFNSLIYGYGKSKDLKSAYDTLDIMKRSGLEPTGDTYTSLICAFAANANDADAVKRIPELINEANKNEIILTDRDMLDVIKTLALADNKCYLIDELLNNISKAMGYNQECLRVVSELIHNHELDTALRLYSTMKPSQVQVQQKTVGLILIRQLVKSKVSPEIVINLCEDLKSKGYNDYGISKALECALQMGDIVNARIYMDKYKEKNPMRVHYYWPILARSNDEMSVFKVLSEDMVSMTNAEYSILHDTFADYVWPKVKSDVDSFIERCKDVGYSYTLTVNSYIDYLLKENRISDASRFLSLNKYSNVRLQSRVLIESLGEAYCDNPDVGNTMQIIKEIIRNPNRSSPFSASGQSLQQVDWCARLLFHISGIRPDEKSKYFTPILMGLYENGLKISLKSATILRTKNISPEDNELLNKLSSEKIEDLFYFDTEDMTKPRREMTIEELEENLIELRSKGLNTRGVLRSLLMAYCRRTRFNAAERKDEIVLNAQKRVNEIIELLNLEGFEFSNAMYSALIEFYVNCENLDEAVNARRKITDDFNVDPHKIISFATVYVKKGQTDAAIAMIKEELERVKKTNIIEDDNADKSVYRNIDRVINRLLNAIIDQTKDANIVKEVFKLCVDYSQSPVTTLMSGPLIKVHLQNDDLPNALAEYVNCSVNYRVVPWKVELMRIFLEKADSSSLQTIIDHSNAIHGEMSTLVDLATACIDIGKLKQAKKLLDTPGLRIRQEKLDIICDKYITDEKINELGHFVSLSKNLFDVDRDFMYKYLIKGYAKLNDPQKALNVWTLMQEENVQPSDGTLRLLSDVLTQHNITPPFAIPPPLPPPSIKVPSQTKQTPDTDKGSFNELNLAIKSGDITKALEIKQFLESRGEFILLSHQCAIIELLLNADRVKEASNIAQSLLKNGRFPAPRILRFLLTKLAKNGDLEMLETLQEKLPDSITQTAWYTSIVANAYVNTGKADYFLDNVLSNLKPFPLGGVLALLSARADLESKIVDIANKEAESDYHLPQNMIWLHYMMNERYDDAKKLFESNPKFKELLLFTSLLDKVRETKNPTMGRKLIDTLLGSNLTPKSIGIAYGALIDVLVDMKEIDDAEDIVINELVNNVKMRVDNNTGEKTKIVNIEDVNRTPLSRLINAIREVKQREPKFSLPQRSTKYTPKRDDDDGSSSDEEKLGVKQK